LKIFAVTLRQNERFMLGDGPSGRLGKGPSDRNRSSLRRSSSAAAHHLLGLTIHADAEARFARAVFLAGSGRPGAGISSLHIKK